MDAAAWDDRYAATELIWSAGPNQFVEEALHDLPPGRGLDLACGEGRNALWLAGRGWQMTAMDFSSVALDKGRRLAEQRGVDGIDWLVGDALNDPLPDGLDLAVLAYLQIPAAQRRQVLRRAFAALRGGGTFFLVAHDSTNLTEGTGGPQDAAVLYTAEDVLDDLAGSGVEVVRAERVARVVTAPDEHGPAGTAWDALVHLRRTG